MLNKIKEFIKNYTPVFIAILSLVLYVCWHSYKENHKVIIDNTTKAVVTQVDEKGTVKSDSKVVVKDTEGDSMFSAKEYLIAKGNNREVRIPISTHTEYLKSTADSPDKGNKESNGKEITYHNEIDVTSLVRPLVPKWEVGVGIGRHRGHTYVPVSVQRDYKVDKAVRLEVHIGGTKTIDGVEVQHVWKF